MIVDRYMSTNATHLPDLMDEPTEIEGHLWELLEQGGERLPMLTAAEAEAATWLLRIMASGDGEGHEAALQLANTLRRRMPDDV